jgi:hypothetical protein
MSGWAEGLGRKDAEAAAMDGLSQKEMFVQEG